MSVALGPIFLSSVCMASAAQVTAHVPHQRPRLLHCVSQLLARYAELFRPVIELVVLFDIDALVVGLAGLLEIVCHGSSSRRNALAVQTPYLGPTAHGLEPRHDFRLGLGPVLGLQAGAESALPRLEL